jgi:hypothetical protein
VRRPERSALLTWLLVACLVVILAIAVAGCATPAPVVVTKTVTQTVDVPGPVQKIPAALSADCPPAPLPSTSLADILGRLSSVETALAQCRIQLQQIRALK